MDLDVYTSIPPLLCISLRQIAQLAKRRSLQTNDSTLDLMLSLSSGTPRFTWATSSTLKQRWCSGSSWWAQWAQTSKASSWTTCRWTSRQSTSYGRVSKTGDPSTATLSASVSRPSWESVLELSSLRDWYICSITKLMFWNLYILPYPAIFKLGEPP